MFLPGTGGDVTGEDAAAGGAAGAGDWAGCARAAAGSASSATMAAEPRWLDRIVFIESFLVLTLSAIWKGGFRPRAGCTRWVRGSVAVINGRRRRVRIGRRRPVIDCWRRCRVIPVRRDRGTDAKADDPADDRRPSGVATTTTMIVPATTMIVPAPMPVRGLRDGGYPKPATSTAVVRKRTHKAISLISLRLLCATSHGERLTLAIPSSTQWPTEHYQQPMPSTRDFGIEA
jgi:hypothetical protein